MELKKVELFPTLEEREYIAENEIITGGKVVNYSVIDVTKIAKRIIELVKKDLYPRYIQIIPLFKNEYKEPSRYYAYQKDPSTGVLYGLYIGEDNYSNPKWQKVMLSEVKSYDLMTLNDCKEWVACRTIPEIDGTPFAVAVPFYKVENELSQAKETINKVDKIRQAWDIVDELKITGREMIMFARYLGINFQKDVNKSVVLGKLYNFATDSPMEMIRAYTDNDKKLKELFETAKSLGIVQFDVERGYIFNNFPMGKDIPEAIKIIKTDQVLFTKMSNDVLRHDAQGNELDKQIKEKA